MSAESPRVSVVIRSYKRLAALAELLEIVLAQEHDSFEVVVVEQTPAPAPEELARPAARNEGVRHSRGVIVLLIDDDDLPLVPDWIAAHDRAYRADPTLVGLSARMVRQADEPCPYPDALRPFIRRRCMSYSVLKTPYTYARFDEDVTHVGWLHGSNASFRREFGLKIGLWDTTVRSSDEHSFALRAHKAMEPGQHFGYVAYPPALQRLDIRGGMDKRFVTARAELVNNLRYRLDDGQDLQLGVGSRAATPQPRPAPQAHDGYRARAARRRPPDPRRAGRRLISRPPTPLPAARTPDEHR